MRTVFYLLNEKCCYYHHLFHSKLFFLNQNLKNPFYLLKFLFIDLQIFLNYKKNYVHLIIFVKTKLNHILHLNFCKIDVNKFKNLIFHNEYYFLNNQNIWLII
jgi:hypothetical protein